MSDTRKLCMKFGVHNMLQRSHVRQTALTDLLYPKCFSDDLILWTIQFTIYRYK